MTSEEALDEIDRIHDDEPERAAAALRTLDSAGLPAGRLPLFGFLLLHVLGEKLGHWTEAADRLESLLTARKDAPLAVLAHAAAAAHLAGRPGSQALADLAAAGGAAEAKLLVALAALGWRAPSETAAFATELERLANESEQFDANGPLGQRLAIGFNNATSRLLDLVSPPVDATPRSALLAGSAAALRFWLANGTWVNHERALYLRALVHNRVGNAAAARDACRQALDVIQANGEEPIDQTFLRLQLAGALITLGELAEGQQQVAAARSAAAQWDDAGLKSWFESEYQRLFGSEERRA